MVLERCELYVGSEVINNLPTTIEAVRSAFRIDEMSAAGLKTVKAYPPLRWVSNYMSRF